MILRKRSGLLDSLLKWKYCVMCLIYCVYLLCTVFQRFENRLAFSIQLRSKYLLDINQYVQWDLEYRFISKSNLNNRSKMKYALYDLEVIRYLFDSHKIKDEICALWSCDRLGAGYQFNPREEIKDEVALWDQRI